MENFRGKTENSRGKKRIVKIIPETSENLAISIKMFFKEVSTVFWSLDYF
jgi:hypothetical protein